MLARMAMLLRKAASREIRESGRRGEGLDVIEGVGVAVGDQVARTGWRVLEAWIGMVTIVSRLYKDVDAMS